MRLCVHGDSLYAWLTAAKLAETGNHVVIRSESGLAQHMLVQKEPGLRALLDVQSEAGRLQFQEWRAPITERVRVHLLAMDCPVDVMAQVIKEIIATASSDIFLIVLDSMPVGTLDHFHALAEQEMANRAQAFKVYVVGMPMFVREGTALADFSRPSVLLVSSDHDHASRLVLDLMRPFVRQATKVMVVPHTTGELIKLGINAMLATRISFINEMASLAEKLGIDIELVRKGLSADPRIGGAYLSPGCGFGGPSFSEQLLSYSKTVQEELDTSGLIDAVLAINDSQREILFRKLWRFFRGQLANKRIAIWGAAFKPSTASLENSVVQPLLQALWAQNCITVVYDPMAGDALRNLYHDQSLLEIAPSAVAAVDQADAMVLVTAWDEFWNPDFEMLKQNLKQPAIFDGRNIYDPEYMKQQGFRYFGIGRGESI